MSTATIPVPEELVMGKLRSGEWRLSSGHAAQAVPAAASAPSEESAPPPPADGAEATPGLPAAGTDQPPAGAAGAAGTDQPPAGPPAGAAGPAAQKQAPTDASPVAAAAAEHTVATTASASMDEAPYLNDDTLMDALCAPLRARCIAQPAEITNKYANVGDTLHHTRKEVDRAAREMPGKPIYLEHTVSSPQSAADMRPLGRLEQAWVDPSGGLRAAFTVASDSRRSRLVARGIRRGVLREVSLGERHLLGPDKRKQRTDIVELSVVRKGDTPGTLITDYGDANGTCVLTAASFGGMGLDNDLIEALVHPACPRLDTLTPYPLSTCASAEAPGGALPDEKTIETVYLRIAPAAAAEKSPMSTENIATPEPAAAPSAASSSSAPAAQAAAPAPAATTAPAKTTGDAPAPADAPASPQGLADMKAMEQRFKAMETEMRRAMAEAAKARDEATKAEEARVAEQKRLADQHAQQIQALKDKQRLEKLEENEIKTIRAAHEAAAKLLEGRRGPKDASDREDLETARAMLEDLLKQPARLLDQNTLALALREARSVHRFAPPAHPAAHAAASEAAPRPVATASSSEAAADTAAAAAPTGAADGAPQRKSDAEADYQRKHGGAAAAAEPKKSTTMERLLAMMNAVAPEKPAASKPAATTASADEPEWALGDIDGVLRVLHAVEDARCRSSGYGSEAQRNVRMNKAAAEALHDMKERGVLTETTASKKRPIGDWAFEAAYKASRLYDNSARFDRALCEKVATAPLMKLATAASEARQFLRGKRNVEHGL